MGITDITSIDPGVADLFSDPASRTPAKNLGQDDFLKLLVAQMTTQDPMNPVGNTEFIAQMAQFTSLEQARATANSIAELGKQQQLVQANGLIGREVTLAVEESNPVKGLVTGVSIQDGTPFIVVGGQTYSLSALLSVTEPAPVVTTVPGTSRDPESSTDTQSPVPTETTN